MSKVIEVTYTAEQFIKACFGEGINDAKRYVKENPKEKYGADDFAEVWRMNPHRTKIDSEPGGVYMDRVYNNDPAWDNAMRIWEDE